MADEKFVRIHITIPEAELAAIDEWSFSKRIRTRAEAMRTLMKYGMEYREAVWTTNELAHLFIDAVKGDIPKEELGARINSAMKRYGDVMNTYSSIVESETEELKKTLEHLKSIVESQSAEDAHLESDDKTTNKRS